jgi:hypothetical protein
MDTGCSGVMISGSEELINTFNQKFKGFIGIFSLFLLVKSISINSK